MGMMGWMRRTSRYFLAVVVLTFVGSLAYFGATQDRGAAEAIATVNGEPILVGEYQQAYRQAVEQYRQALGARFTEEALRTLRVRDQVLDRLIADRLVAQRARAEGVWVHDRELAREITRMGVFHERGRFSREQYLRVLRRAELTPAAFEQDLRMELVRRRLQGLLTDGVRVTEGELRLEWEARRSRVRVAWVLVPDEPVRGAPDPGEAELEAYLRAHAARYARPERRRALVAVLPADRVPVPPVSDQDVEAAYETRRGEFEQPERVRVAHILVRVPAVGGSAAEDQARAKAEAALGRIRAGADFAQVAREVSEDPATASRGGEVGLVARGELVQPFEEAAFRLAPGEVAGPVRTPFGYHVIKLLERVPASRKTLGEVAATLRAELAAARQRQALEAQAQVVQQALASAPDFAAAARAHGLTVHAVGPVARGEPLGPLGAVRELGEALFQPALGLGGVSAAVRIPQGFAVLRLEAIEPAQRPEEVRLADVRGAVLEAVRREQARARAQARARELAEAWRTGQDARERARREGLPVGELGPFSRAEPPAHPEVGGVVAAAALELPQGGVSEPLAGPRGFYVVRVLSREAPDPAAFAQARAELERDLLARKRARVWQDWVAALRAQASVEVNRKLLPAE